MRLVRLADCPVIAWKNGGGTTQEIAVYPPDAGMDDFIWRLSTAQVAVPGTFSRFADVDRLIAILSGTLDLAIDGREPVRLDRYSPPFSFPGDVATAGSPVGGPVADLNLMVRRGSGQGQMTAIPAGKIDILPPTTIIVACRGCILELGGEAFKLCAGDAAIFDRPPKATAIVDAPSLIMYVGVGTSKS
jgi:environmental stress-induced protein Ves